MKHVPPFREVPYLPVNLKVEEDGAGNIYLTNMNPLRPGPVRMAEPVVHWGEAEPDRLWLAQRDPLNPDGEGWQEVTYGEGLRRVRALAGAMLEMGLGPGKPLMILSRNSIEHALMTYAAAYIGCPVCPVTAAHSLQSSDFARLKYAVELIKPTAFFVEEAEPFQRALDAVAGETPVIAARGVPKVSNPVSMADMEAREGGAEVDRAFARVTGDMHAKYLLTSGSTGVPKAVILTNANIAINAKMIRSVWDVERVEEISGQQVMISFLPWSHSFGANAILHSMTDWGGALYVDWGAPVPGRMETMIRNLREVAPTQHTTVPAAWAALATALENDEAMARNFFSRLMVMAYGGAAMGQDLYERIQAVAVRTTGQRVSLSAGYGATETTPTASNVHWPSDRMGLLGLPIPGSLFKMAPVGQKMELRCKGPHIMAGYLNDPVRTAEAFDEDGWLKLGDAVRFADPDRPEAGLAFDGRIAEEFKLANGTWVSCGMVRMKAVAACDGLLSDAVVCGLNEDDISLIGFLDEARCAKFLGEAKPLAELAGDQRIVDAIADRLAAYNRDNPAPSLRVARFVLEQTPPSLSEGEITEKGYINQACVRDVRAERIKSLYAKPPGVEVFTVPSV